MVVLSSSVTGRIVALPDPYSMIASKIRIQDSDTRFAIKIHIPDSYSRFTYRIRVHDSLNRFVFKLMPSSMNGCMPGGLCSVSFPWPMEGGRPGAMRGILSGSSAGNPSGDLCGASFWEPQHGIRPGRRGRLSAKEQM